MVFCEFGSYACQRPNAVARWYRCEPYHTSATLFCQAGVLSAFSPNNLIQIPPDTNK